MRGAGKSEGKGNFFVRFLVENGVKRIERREREDFVNLDFVSSQTQKTDCRKQIAKVKSWLHFSLFNYCSIQ